MMMARSNRQSFFWVEEGFSTAGMVIALLLTLALIFTCAQVYEVNTASSRVQETADAAVLAAENTVGEFYIVVAICDAIVLTLSLTMLVSLGLGVVCACIPPTAAFSKSCIDAAAKIRDARDSFYASSQRSLEKLQQALPFIATAQAQAVLAANSSEGGSQFQGLVVLAPWEGEASSVLTFESGDDALGSTESSHEDLSEKAREAEEAAEEANRWKQHAFIHDSGSKDAYCMYERAAHLANMSGKDNPFFSSVDTWSFEAALNRARTYYQLRYDQERPQESSVEERSNSALRKRFYAYAVRTVNEGYVFESEDAFDASFPLLPKNTDEMRATSLYSEAVYPRTQDAQGMLTLHAWEGCPGCALGSASGTGSIRDMDGSPAYVTCPYCSFVPSSMGKVAAASSNIENGFEYHYNEVARAADEYEKARDRLDPLSQEVKDIAEGLFDQIASGVTEACSKRIAVLPPGHWGAIALVVDTSTVSSRFSSPFVDHEGRGALGVRAALSSSTLVRETSDEGKNVITSFLDGLGQEGGVATGAARTILQVWSGLLGVYTQGQEALSASVEDVLNGLPLSSASGLGTWASESLEEVIDEAGFSPPDTAARKAVLVNSGHVLAADDSSFSARLLAVKTSVVQAGEHGTTGSLSAVESLALGAVDDLGSEFEIATIVLVEGVVEIPITVSLPSFVVDGLSSALQSGIDALRSAVSSWTGVRQWQ